MDIDKILERLFFISSKLSIIEVKGDSVEHLFISRAALKELYDVLLSEKIEKEKKEKGDNET